MTLRILLRILFLTRYNTNIVFNFCCFPYFQIIYMIFKTMTRYRNKCYCPSWILQHHTRNVSERYANCNIKFLTSACNMQNARITFIKKHESFHQTQINTCLSFIFKKCSQCSFACKHLKNWSTSSKAKSPNCV